MEVGEVSSPMDTGQHEGRGMKTGTAASMPATMRTGVLFTESRLVDRGGDQPKARQLPTEMLHGWRRGSAGWSWGLRTCQGEPCNGARTWKGSLLSSRNTGAGWGIRPTRAAAYERGRGATDARENRVDLMEHRNGAASVT